MFLVWIVAILAIGYIVIYLIRTEFTEEKILSISNIIRSGWTPVSAGRDAAREHKERLKKEENK